MQHRGYRGTQVGVGNLGVYCQKRHRGRPSWETKTLRMARWTLLRYSLGTSDHTSTAVFIPALAWFALCRAACVNGVPTAAAAAAAALAYASATGTMNSTGAVTAALTTDGGARPRAASATSAAVGRADGPPRYRLSAVRANSAQPVVATRHPHAQRQSTPATLQPARFSSTSTRPS